MVRINHDAALLKEEPFTGAIGAWPSPSSAQEFFFKDGQVLVVGPLIGSDVLLNWMRLQPLASDGASVMLIRANKIVQRFTKSRVHKLLVVCPSEMNGAGANNGPMPNQTTARHRVVRLEIDLHSGTRAADGVP
jgi:hypothetical protein